MEVETVVGDSNFLSHSTGSRCKRLVVLVNINIHDVHIVALKEVLDRRNRSAHDSLWFDTGCTIIFDCGYNFPTLLMSKCFTGHENCACTVVQRASIACCNNTFFVEDSPKFG